MLTTFKQRSYDTVSILILVRMVSLEKGDILYQVELVKTLKEIQEHGQKYFIMETMKYLKIF